MLNPIGGDYDPRSRALLRPNGTYIALTSGGDDFLLVEPDHAGMLALADLVATKQLVVALDSMFPLSEAAKAHEHGEKRGATGKIVLTVVE